MPLVAAGNVTTPMSPHQWLSHPYWVIALGTGSAGVSIPTLICCLCFDNCFKPSLPTGTNHGPSMISVAAPNSEGTAPVNGASEVTQIKAIRGKDKAQSSYKERRTGIAEQTWDQTELRGWNKSSGKLHPFPFQCWASSSIDLQVSARKTCDWGGSRDFLLI